MQAAHLHQSLCSAAPQPTLCCTAQHARSSTCRLQGAALPSTHHQTTDTKPKTHYGQQATGPKAEKLPQMPATCEEMQGRQTRMHASVLLREAPLLVILKQLLAGLLIVDAMPKQDLCTQPRPKLSKPYRRRCKAQHVQLHLQISPCFAAKEVF